MRTYTETIAEITRNRGIIAEDLQQIDRLNRDEEKTAAIKSGKIAEYKRLHAETEANAGKIADLSASIYARKIENKILEDNAKAALFSEFWPVLLEILKPYAGKPYGEKTKEKIKQAANAHGFGFYFNARGDSVTLYTLTGDGYRDPSCLDCTAYAYTSEGAAFIDDNNKITAADAKPRTNEHYTEDTAAKAAEIIKAEAAYREALDAARAAGEALAALLPTGSNCRPEYISNYRGVI